MNIQTGLLQGLLKVPSYRRAEREAQEKAVQWLEFMGIRALANREAGTLAYGHQRRLEIARCMITQPRLLMLDEPAAGPNPQEKRDLHALTARLRNEFRPERSREGNGCVRTFRYWWSPYH